MTDVVAHVGSLSTTVGGGGVPTWLTVATGGVVVAASALFTSLLTDHEGVRAVNGWGLALPAPDRAARPLSLVGVAVLGAVLVTGFAGPTRPTANFAIVVVWAGWWAGYPITVYLGGNTWPALDPWRALARALPRLDLLEYPERLGTWPSVAGLFALVFVEVVTPLARAPRLLAALVLAYTVVTLVGAAAVGVERWFDSVDPIAHTFRCYGRVAPVQRTDDGLALRLPGAALADGRPLETPGDTAFVLALLWVTTYDGLVSTPAWAAVVRALTGLGLPRLLVYVAALLAGFWLFGRAYALAARTARRTTPTYVTADALERRFAPALLPIAAGYHLAHFLGYFLGLSPALATLLVHPLGPPGVVPVLVLPAWLGTVQLALVVLGHLLAVWVAHSLALEFFPGVLAPVRSQYPFAAVMVAYTATSAWVVGQPLVPPPHV